MTPERKLRCRMHSARENPCPNEVIDPDPKAMQICPHHALKAAQLLAESGAIQIKTAPTTRRSKA